jgi:hypothetical protein
VRGGFPFWGKAMADNSSVKVRLWLHRDDAENWWVSTAGVGVPTNLPKSKVVVPDGAVIGLLGGAVEVELPRWLAEQRNLVAQRDERQGELL